MSSLVVNVVAIEDVLTHSGADLLQLAIVGGWQVVIAKDSFAAGDSAVYFPVDTVLPQEWTDRFGVTKYCSPVNGGAGGYRVRCAKLRGEPSFGLLVHLPEYQAERWSVGDDVAEYYGATKYEPPVNYHDSDSVAVPSLFARYTDIENLRHYSNVFLHGEEVVVSAKIHGSNNRLAIIDGVRYAGSHNLGRKEPESPAEYKTNRYWYPWSLESVQHLLEYCASKWKQVVLFGEIHGKGVQGQFDYGLQGLGFAAFDLLVDGSYCNFDTFAILCDSYGVPRVPVLYQGDYNGIEHVAMLAIGPAHSGKHIREGVVVRPAVERTDPKIGRVVLKYVSDQFLLKDYGNTKDQ